MTGDDAAEFHCFLFAHGRIAPRSQLSVARFAPGRVGGSTPKPHEPVAPLTLARTLLAQLKSEEEAA